MAPIFYGNNVLKSKKRDYSTKLRIGFCQLPKSVESVRKRKKNLDILDFLENFKKIKGILVALSNFSIRIELGGMDL